MALQSLVLGNDIKRDADDVKQIRFSVKLEKTFINHLHVAFAFPADSKPEALLLIRLNNFKILPVAVLAEGTSVDPVPSPLCFAIGAGKCPPPLSASERTRLMALLEGRDA